MARAGKFLLLPLCLFLLGCPIPPRPSIAGYEITLDDADNVYILGNFNIVHDFDPGPGVENRGDRGRRDTFLVKYDSSGAFQWVCVWEGEYFQGQVHGPLFQVTKLAVDDSGNAYLAGSFDSPADFNPGQGIDMHQPVFGNYVDPFLTRINADGSYGWTIVWGGPSEETVNEISTDQTGNIWMMGLYRDTVDFDPGPAVVNRSPLPMSTGPVGGIRCTDTFLSQYDPNGSFLQVITWHKDTGIFLASDFEIDTNGEFFLSFTVDEPVDADPGKGSLVLTPAGMYNSGCISRFDSQLEIQWAQLSRPPSSYGADVTIDNLGNIALGGTTIRDRRNWSHDSFIEVLDPNGNHQWTHELKGTDVGSNINATPIFDPSGDLYAVGRFFGSADLDPGSGSHVYSSSGNSHFILKLDSTGSLQWVRLWSGSKTGWISGSAVDSSGNLWLAGDFGDRIQFHSGTTATIRNNPGFITPFLLKFDSNGNL